MHVPHQQAAQEPYGRFEHQAVDMQSPLLERHPEALKAIENEMQGLLANGTWDESQIRPKSEVFSHGQSFWHQETFTKSQNIHQ